MTHPTDFRATLRSSILDSLASRCGQELTPAVIDDLAAEIFYRVRDDTRAALSAAPQQGAKGLHGKYIIYRSADGSPVKFPCFVLRVDGADNAAMAAIQAYAAHPECAPELAADLAKQVQFQSAAPQQGPSDEWIEWLREDHAISKDDAADFANAVRKAVSCYGSQPAPVAVAEGWPEFSDCDKDETLWCWHLINFHWCRCRLDLSVHTHWLPHWALPLPEAQR